MLQPQLVTVRKLNSPLEAELMKNWLRSEGKQAYSALLPLSFR